MKKILFFAAMMLVMAGCAKQSPAGIWSAESEHGPKLIVLNEDGTAKSMGLPVKYESWSQDGDTLVLNGVLKHRGRHHGPKGMHHGRHGRKPGCAEANVQTPDSTAPACCKEGQPEAGQKPCCKEAGEGEQKPCCKEGKGDKGPKPCCKGEKKAPKQVVDKVLLKSLSDDQMVLVFTNPKSGEQKEVSFKRLAEMPEKPCCKEGKPEHKGQKPCCDEQKAEPAAEPVEAE